MTDQVQIPLPGDKIEDQIVVASCWVIDEDGHDAGVYGNDHYAKVILLTLRKHEPFYRVGEWSLYEHGDDGWYADEIGKYFPNIIPATNHYSDLTGGY